MSSSYYGYWLIAFGVGITALMITVNGLTSNTTQDYLSSREITESAMLDSIDYGYYRDFNEVKMNKEKFMEVFTRRLSEAQGNETYQLNFYEMYETPPKVSVEIVNENAASNSTTQSTYDVTTRVDAILQMFSLKDLNITGGTTEDPTNPTNPVDPNQSTTPSTPTEPNPTNPDIINDDPNIPLEIKGEPLNAELYGKHGLALVPGNKFPALATAYKTLQGAKGGKGTPVDLLSTTQAEDPIIFTIIGETQDGYYWAIKFNDKSGEEQYGWVYNLYMAINLKEYLPSNVTYEIRNATDSIFRVKETDIPDVTGKKLYNDSYFTQFNYGSGYGFIPLDYHYAQKIKTIAESLPSDYGFRIYDAYRPQSVGAYVNYKVGSTFGHYYGQNAINGGLYDIYGMKLCGKGGAHAGADINGYCGNIVRNAATSDWTKNMRCDISDPYYQCYVDGDNETADDYIVALPFFISGDASNHNYGCAVDITLTQNSTTLESYSPMHELSGRSMKYDMREYYKNNGNIVYSNAYNDNSTAKLLNEMMKSKNKSDGYNIADIPSEWWHYNDSACLNRRTTNGKEDERYAMSFWSNV